MLHEAVFALGGYPGVLFSEEGEKTSFFKHLHPSERALLDRITRVATDYVTLKKFIDQNICSVSSSATCEGKDGLSGQGGYMQAFCNALYDVLQPYREDIVSLEKEILNDPYLPLSHVTYRAEKYAIFLNVLNRMVKQLAIEEFRGCQILGFLKRQLASGVDEIKDAVSRILYSCHVFFYKQLTCWLLYGHLMDQHKEFFIQCLKDPASGTSISALKSVNNTYSVDDSIDNNGLYPAFCEYGIDFSMLPPYIPASIAYKILFTGQTILMFSNNPDDKSSISETQKGNVSIWGNKEEEFLHKLQELQLCPVFDLYKFEMTMNEIRACVTEHLWHVAVEKAELFQQLRLIKDFFLLGRGELFLEFIRQVSPILMRSSPPVSAREVNQAFQISARKVLLTDESALDKFYFIIQNNGQGSQGEKADGAVNWEHLGLRYKVSWPLHLLFTAETLEFYNMLFKFLLRVKKVQADLHSTWMEHIMAYKILQGNVLQSPVWQLRTGLTFLVDNLQYYLQADVLESQYVQMQTTIQNTQDFEKVQQAHALFQSNILSQTFLRRSFSNDTNWTNQSVIPSGPSQTEAVEGNHVHRSLDRILSLSENFCECMQKWKRPLDEEELEELLEMDGEFTAHVRFLMQLLFSLRSEPCGAHLSQLLLRLDFNRWFSHCTSIQSVNKVQDLSST